MRLLSFAVFLLTPFLAAAADAGPAESPFGAALGRALADPSERVTARLFVECFDGGEFRTVEILGRGVGLWDGRRQFSVPPEVIESLLHAVRRSYFAGLEEVYGGKLDDPARPPAERPGGAAALRLLCGVTVSLGEVSKRVVQLDKGERSDALAALAAEIFDHVRELAGTGIEAADLGDGLRKVAAGELVPETLRLVFHRQPRRAGDGFLLRLEGRVATSRGFAAGRGYGPPHRLELDEAWFRELATRLAALDLDQLPGNLYAADYTDFSLEVLGSRSAVQAQRFAGMAPDGAGEHQRDFDLLAELVYNLHLQVVADGSLVEE